MLIRKAKGQKGKRAKRQCLLAFLPFCLLALAPRGQSVVTPKAPGTRSGSAALPDIAGLRPGIGLPEARRLLRSHDSKGHIQVGQVQIPELGSQRFPSKLLFTSAGSSASEMREVIQLELTLPPEQPVVWGIVRLLFFEKGKEETRPSLLAQLRQRYGRESYGITVPIVNLYWAFDEEGRRVNTGESTPNCAVPGAWDLSPDVERILSPPGRGVSSSSSSPFPATSLLLRPAVPAQGVCKPLVHVKAVLQPSGARGLELIESTTVAVIDGPLAARAHAATTAYRVAKKK